AADRAVGEKHSRRRVNSTRVVDRRARDSVRRRGALPDVGGGAMFLGGSGARRDWVVAAGRIQEDPVDVRPCPCTSTCVATADRTSSFGPGTRSGPRYI